MKPDWFPISTRNSFLRASKSVSVAAPGQEKIIQNQLNKNLVYIPFWYNQPTCLLAIREVGSKEGYGGPGHQGGHHQHQDPGDMETPALGVMSHGT